jgi:hypothetical protein
MLFPPCYGDKGGLTRKGQKMKTQKPQDNNNNATNIVKNAQVEFDAAIVRLTSIPDGEKPEDVLEDTTLPKSAYVSVLKVDLVTTLEKGYCVTLKNGGKTTAYAQIVVNGSKAKDGRWEALVDRDLRSQKNVSSFFLRVCRNAVLLSEKCRYIIAPRVARFGSEPLVIKTIAATDKAKAKLSLANTACRDTDIGEYLRDTWEMTLDEAQKNAENAKTEYQACVKAERELNRKVLLATLKQA